MAYKTEAHQNVRHGLFRCAKCERNLGPAKYEGEFVFSYDENSNPKMTSVYLKCQRCGCLNDVSMDTTDDDGFMNMVNEIAIVPHRAKKITAAPESEPAL